MRFYYRLSDPSLAPWLMVWKRRVVAIYNSGVRTYNRTEITALFWVQIRINGDAIYVNLTGFGAMYFEFQTSGFPIAEDAAFGAVLGVFAYKAASIGCTVNFNTKTVDADMNGHQRTANLLDVEPLHRPHQIQLHDEPNAVPIKEGLGYPRVLYESFAPSHGHTGVYLRSYHPGFIAFAASGMRGNVTAHRIRDVSYDLPWADSHGKEALRLGFLAGDTDWPRASGIRKAEHILWGEREFAVYVDSFDQVSVFPTSEIGPLVPIDPFTGGQNIPVDSVQMERVPFPAWVYAKTELFKDYRATPTPDPSDDTGLYQFPEIDWKIHPDGTKMCAVVYEREEAVFDSAFFAPYATDTGTLGPGEFYPTTASFYLNNKQTMGVDAQIGASVYSYDTSDKWYVVAPGILEVVIDIELTGPLPKDFTLSLTVREVRRPTTSPYCPFAVGYVYHDVLNKESTKFQKIYDAHRGDMMVLDIECFGRRSDGQVASLYSVKNLDDSDNEINVMGVGTTQVAESPAPGLLRNYQSHIVACNMQTLSFVLRDTIVMYNGAGLTNRTHHFGLSVYVLNKYQTTLYPALIPEEAKDILNASYTIENQREKLLSQCPGIAFMPLNDIRGWGDAEMDSLREWYCRSFTHETYTPPINPADNWLQVTEIGHKYYKTGARDFPAPTTDQINWYRFCLGMQGIAPFGMFDITNPLPGWCQYLNHMRTINYVTPYTTFFSHPNGTWALFDYQFIYNSNGLPFGQFEAGGSSVAMCVPEGFEHCIFDRVHFVSQQYGSRVSIDSSFLKLYNKAIAKEKKNNTLLDDAEELNSDYSDMRIQFERNWLVDAVDFRVNYAELVMTWPPTNTKYYYKERGYRDGGLDLLVVGAESDNSGGLLHYTLGAWATLVSNGGQFYVPLQHESPIRFSSCVLIAE